MTNNNPVERSLADGQSPHPQLATDYGHLGLGLGLRSQHFNHIVQHRPAVDWFEIISENFIDSGGRPRQMLRKIAQHYPIVMHGVSLSIGSTDPLDWHYLTRLKSLANELQPAWVSDHLCWTGALSLNSHDLLPLPLNQACLRHVVDRVQQVQGFLGRPLVLENPSTYLTFSQSDMSEWQFFSELVAATGCQILLDVNNVYVSAFNHGFDPDEYIQGLPHQAIVQMHLAGHQHCGDYIIDTHDGPVIDPVWRLFNLAWQLTGGVATCVEWDGNIPPFDQYHQQVLKARDYMAALPQGFGQLAPLAHDHLPPSPSADQPQRVSHPIDFIVPDKAMF